MQVLKIEYFRAKKPPRPKLIFASIFRLISVEKIPRRRDRKDSFDRTPGRAAS